MTPAPPRLRILIRGAALRCPRCGVGRLFRGWFTMHEGCPSCGLPFTREPGFYLGSIYLNYAATVLLTGGIYATLVLGLGLSHERTLGACLMTAVLFPIIFFRHARSLLLALDYSVNQNQVAGGSSALSAERLASLASDDGRAGCFMGVTMALILLFGIGMAIATLLFSGAGSMPLD